MAKHGFTFIFDKYSKNDDFLFASENRNAFKKDFYQAAHFLQSIFDDVLPMYNLDYLLGPITQQKKPEVNKALSPYTVHISEAVIAISYVNRHNFKMVFDKRRDFLNESKRNVEIFLCEFCKRVYREGYVEQFLIMCGFFIDLTIYYYFYFNKNIVYSVQLLFGDIFRYVLRDTFYQKGGGWEEVKEKSKPWWHAYRNAIFKKNETQDQQNQNKSPDFHNPLHELCNESLTAIFVWRGYSPILRTSKTSLPVELDPEVPSSENTSPIYDKRRSGGVQNN